MIWSVRDVKVWSAGFWGRATLDYMGHHIWNIYQFMAIEFRKRSYFLGKNNKRIVSLDARFIHLVIAYKTK